jgi:hypothetical protein
MYDSIRARKHPPPEVNSMPDETIQSAPCSICLRVIDGGDLTHCPECHGSFCESCPICSCSDQDPAIRALRDDLLAGAIERAQLQIERELMGADSLTMSKQARLQLLTDVVPSLRAEVNRLDEMRDGDDYPKDDQS